MNDIHIRTINSQKAAVVKKNGSLENLTDLLSKALGEVDSVLHSFSISPTGPAFARYLEVGDTTIVFEAGFPINEEVSEDGIEMIELPGGEALTTLYVGPYEGLDDVHNQMKNWMNENSRLPSGDPWEVYVTDPTTEPDQAKWQTEVFWPLKAI